MRTISPPAVHIRETNRRVVLAVESGDDGFGIGAVMADRGPPTALAEERAGNDGGKRTGTNLATWTLGVVFFRRS
jgi:hypothetical protein